MRRRLHLVDDYPAGVRRPLDRADCRDGLRPCPFVSCRHHLYLDVRPSGSLQINFPDLEPDELKETCSLDVADRGGEQTLDEIGALMNVTRERIRQIEAKASAKFARMRPIREQADANALEPNPLARWVETNRRRPNFRVPYELFH